MRPSGAGRAASAPPNGGRGADPNAPTTAKNRVKTPHDVTAPKKNGGAIPKANDVNWNVSKTSS